jgi:hypothetical protein
MALRKNEPDFRNLVNSALADAIESGKYFELYEKYFGAKGEVPYPMSGEIKRLLQSSAAEFRKTSGGGAK